MTGVPVQGAGTDDELRESVSNALVAAVGPLMPQGWVWNLDKAADALLSDPGVLAAMRHREQQAAAKALRGVADELLGFGDTAPSKQNVALAAWLQATADNASLDPNGRPDQ